MFNHWGGKFRPFTNFLEILGVTNRKPCPHTHEQNRLVERIHRHIVENGLTLLAQAHLPFKFWDEAFRTAVFLLNRLPTNTLHHSTPFQALFNQQLKYDHLRVFGCALLVTQTLVLITIIKWHLGLPCVFSLG